MFAKFFGIAQVVRYSLRVVANVASFLADQIDQVMTTVSQGDWNQSPSQAYYSH